MIRLPDIPGLQGSQINAPELRAGAVAAPAVALGNAAESIYRVSDQFHDTAVKLQKLENGRIVSEKRQQLARDYGEFSVELQKDLDPASRMSKTQDFLTNYKGQMDSEDLPPAARADLLEHYDKFATNMTIGQAEDSARLGLRRAGAAFDNELNLAATSNDREMAMRAVGTAVETGAVLPEEGEEALRKFDELAAFRAQQSAIQENPIETLRQLDDPDFLKQNPFLSPEKHEQLRGEAEQQANRYRADFANDQIISGVVPTLEELQTMADNGLIDKSTHARWASKLREDVKPQMDPAIYEETYGQIMAYDPARDPSGRVEAQLRGWIGSQALPETSIKELNERLTKRLNPEDVKKPKSVHASAFSSKIATDFNRGDWGQFRFPVDHDKDPFTAPVLRVTQGEYDKAWKLRGQFTDQWRAILDTLPDDASFEVVNGQYEALKTTYKDKKPLPDLKLPSTSSSAPAEFDPEAVYRKTQPAGNFGGQPIKPPGVPYKGASATVFGGANDPADNGQSAFGGKTGTGGREGTAIPQDLLKAKFPGKDKDWIAANVRTVVKDPQGVMHTLDVADFGTAEWVWQRAGRPTLDLTEGAVKQMGGQVLYRDGKQVGVKGLDNLDFSVVSIDTGKPLAGLSWQDAKSAWFATNKPPNYEAANTSMIALRDAWAKAQATASND